jgi:hypothetical protein
MFRFSILSLTAGVAAVALFLSGPLAAAPKVVRGTVGPGFTSTYRFVCDPHASSMKGSFRVS